jgi:excisionase family DNA binding protein
MRRSGRTKDEERTVTAAPVQLAPVRRMRVPEAAAFLGVPRRSLEDVRWRKRNSVPVIRIGRSVLFDERALERYLRLHRDRLSYALLDHGAATTGEPESS